VAKPWAAYRALSQGLRRGVLLAQLANSAAAIMSDPIQLTLMQDDFRAIDFRMVLDDAQNVFPTERRAEMVEECASWASCMRVFVFVFVCVCVCVCPLTGV
jgi:hypothetical protein